MKKLLATIIAIGSIALFYSCKTTEANYRAAYERTIANRDSANGYESAIYGRGRSIGSQIIVGSGDTIESRSNRVTITPNGGGENITLRHYNVVVGQFKQVFNARSMRKRLVDAGYTDALVVQTSEPYYYVILSTHEVRQKAVEALQAIPEDFPVKLREPLPFILSAANFR